MKQCLKCNSTKELSEFYPHKKMADGHLRHCKSCVKSRIKERELKLSLNSEWIERERKRHREKYYRLNYNEKYKPSAEDKKNIMSRYINKYPEKQRCRSAQKPPPGFHSHHWSYNSEHAKDVFFLKPKHHALLHRYLRYDQNVFMYRTLSGDLLDTRSKHEKHIKNVFLLNGIEPIKQIYHAEHP